MIRKLLMKCSLVLLVMSLTACGGLRFSQLSPEAKNFHPKKIAIFPVEIVGSNEEARGSVEQVVAGVLADKHWFADITDAESLSRQLLTNDELLKVMNDYLSKLRTVNFSDPELSKKIGEIVKVDAFLLISIDTWNYAVEKGDKVAKVSLSMKLYEVSTGKVMWKAGHQLTESYTFFKPDLSKVARNVAREMVDYMPR